jgi:hypothetical protein
MTTLRTPPCTWRRVISHGLFRSWMAHKKSRWNANCIHTQTSWLKVQVMCSRFETVQFACFPCTLYLAKAVIRKACWCSSNSSCIKKSSRGNVTGSKTFTNFSVITLPSQIPVTATRCPFVEAIVVVGHQSFVVRLLPILCHLRCSILPIFSSHSLPQSPWTSNLSRKACGNLQYFFRTSIW